MFHNQNFQSPQGHDFWRHQQYGTPKSFQITYGCDDKDDSLDLDTKSWSVHNKCVCYQNVVFMEEYKDKSFEELRAEDYAIRRDKFKPPIWNQNYQNVLSSQVLPTTAPTSTSYPFGATTRTGGNSGPFGAIGQQPAKPFSFGSFGNTATNNSPFGNTATNYSPFGNTATNASPFGNTATNTNPFGNTATNTNPFGNTATNTSPFGNAATNNSLFGNTATNTSPFGNAATNNSPFGNTATNSSPFGSFLPSNPTQTQPIWNTNTNGWKNPNGSSIFGQPVQTNPNPWNPNPNIFQPTQPSSFPSQIGTTTQTPNFFASPCNVNPGSFGSNHVPGVAPYVTPFGTGLQNVTWAPQAPQPILIQSGQSPNFQTPLTNNSFVHHANNNIIFHENSTIQRQSPQIGSRTTTWEDWERMVNQQRVLAMEKNRQNLLSLNKDNNSYSIIPVQKMSSYNTQNMQKPSILDLKPPTFSFTTSWKSLNASVVNEREFSPLKPNNIRSLLDTEHVPSDVDPSLLDRRFFSTNTGPPRRAYSKLKLFNGVTITPQCAEQNFEAPQSRFRLVGNLNQRLTPDNNETNHSEPRPFTPVPVNFSDLQHCGDVSPNGNEWLAEESQMNRNHNLRIPTQTMRPHPKQGKRSTIGEVGNCGVSLSMENCYCQPDIATLNRMVDSYGRCLVKNFEVGHFQYGKAVFDGIIDVQGLNLDKIMQFSPLLVAIYPDENSKPPFGEGLNSPATITLHNVYPTSHDQLTVIKDPLTLYTMRYERVLRLACEKFNGAFISFNAENGDWVFKVQRSGVN